MDKRRKTGLIIMGACSFMLVVLLAAMGTGKEETQEQTEGNAPQEVAEGVTTPLNDSKSDAYMSGDSEGRTSNTQKHWDDCGEMLEQKEEERREGGDATTEDLFGPVPPASSGGGYAQTRPYENPYRETPQEREERHRRRQEEAIEMAERMSGGQTEAEEEVPAPQEQAPEQKQEPVTEVRRTSVISSLDDEAGLIGSFGSDDTIFTDDGTRPFPCMFSKECRLRDGDRVSIILLEDIVVSGTLVPRNTHLMATASLSNRLELKIASLELNGRIIAFGYEAYDIDGSRGIYCPDVGNERATVRSRGTGLISSTLNSRMGRVASDVVSTGVSLLQSRDGERTVSVPAGYTFFIMKKTEQ